MDNHNTRREFIKKMTAASLAASATTIPLASFLSSCSTSVTKIPSTADTVILLWMAGGMAHTETFDPKAYVPYEIGVESKRVLSTFRKVSTAVDGLNFSEGLESINTIGIPVMSHHSRYRHHILAHGSRRN